MKAITTLLIMLLAVVSNAQLQATLDIKKFNSPQGSYIESYLNILSTSIEYKADSSKKDRCKIEVLEIIKKNDSIIDFRKLILENNTVTEESVYSDLLTQQRFFLPNGQYTFEIELKDLLKENSVVITHEENLFLDFKNDQIAISSIEFLDSFWKSDKNTATSKSGYEMIPLVSDYFAPSFEKIAFYFEVYNAKNVLGEEAKYVLQYFIENFETGNIVGSYNKISKQKALDISPTLHAFDINQLPTGNYNLVVQIKDQNNFVIAEQSQRFQRLNMFNNVNTQSLEDINIDGTFIDRINKDSLDEFIYCLRPISSSIEYTIIDNQMDHMNDSTKIKYFYSFWYSRNQEEPEKEWLDYKEHVIDAEKMFGTPVKAGYETDRGRIYLKYGAPNTVTDRPSEPNSYPYQIWHYYKVGQFNNIRFVFYQPDLVTNDYEMLHSNLRGEINNYNWERTLQKRNQQNGNIDDATPDNNWGTNTNTLFKNPN